MNIDFLFTKKENMSGLFPIEDQKEDIELWFIEERTFIESDIKRPLSFEEQERLRSFAELFASINDDIFIFEIPYSVWLTELGVEDPRYFCLVSISN